MDDIKDAAVQQYDSSDNIIGSKNVLGAFITGDVVIFNESYIVVGNETSAKKISATYDLTVIGNITIDEIVVNGKLTVLGNISAKRITCENTFICQGHIEADDIYVGADIIADSIKCGKFSCEGNALIKTTIDIDQSMKTEKMLVACEGIMGEGSFSAPNAIAKEYFEFNGNVQGNIIELESDTFISETGASSVDLSEFPIDEAMRKIKLRLQDEFQRCGELDEDEVIELTRLLADNSFAVLSSLDWLFEVLTNISYQSEISDFGDYLFVKYAKSVLPKQIYSYETIEHIDSIMLPRAEEKINELSFIPRSIENIAMSIKIALQCANCIPMPIDDVLDKIFSSFGLRYTTVKTIVNKVSEKERSIIDGVPI